MSPERRIVAPDARKAAWREKSDALVAGFEKLHNQVEQYAYGPAAASDSRRPAPTKPRRPAGWPTWRSYG